MKKIIFLLLVFAASFASAPKVSAQDSGWWLGGRIGYWHNKIDGVSSNSFALAPEFGYDINSKWSVAGVLGFDYAKVGGTSANVFVIESYARYKYFNKDHSHSSWTADWALPLVTVTVSKSVLRRG